MGASNSPLLGESDQLGSKKLPSGDPRPESEECGRIWSCEARKKALKALEMWPPDPGLSSGSPKRGKPRKRLQRLTPGREDRGGSGGVLQRWLLKKSKDLRLPRPASGLERHFNQSIVTIESENSEASALGSTEVSRNVNLLNVCIH